MEHVREGSWLRFPVGIHKDQRIIAASQNAGCSRSESVAVWACVLDHATSHTPPGSVEKLKADIISVILDMPEDTIQSLLNEFVAMGMIVDGKVADWWRHHEPMSLRANNKAWHTLRNEIFRRDGYACVYCGASDKKLDCDHVVPVSRGGSNDATNLVTACYSCNRAKGCRTADEWRGA